MMGAFDNSTISIIASKLSQKDRDRKQRNKDKLRRWREENLACAKHTDFDLIESAGAEK